MLAMILWATTFEEEDEDNWNENANLRLITNEDVVNESIGSGGVWINERRWRTTGNILKLKRLVHNIRGVEVSKSYLIRVKVTLCGLAAGGEVSLLVHVEAMFALRQAADGALHRHGTVVLVLGEGDITRHPRVPLQDDDGSPFLLTRNTLKNWWQTGVLEDGGGSFSLSRLILLNWKYEFGLTYGRT